MDMKFRNLGFFLKEGTSNILANKWMGIASATIVFATLYIFGIFFLFAANVKNISAKVVDQPMHAFTIGKADEKMAQNVKLKVEKIQGVSSVELVSKEEGLKELKIKFNDYDELFKGIDSGFLSYKLIVHMSNPENAEQIKKSIVSIPEIEKVNYSKETLEKVLEVTKIFRMMSYVLIVILSLISLFIIVYTIKLTVFARRREINIMKYVGATDWFIRWPFVIEGLIIGITGSILSAYSIFISYGYFYNSFGNVSMAIFELIPLNFGIRNQMFFVLLFIGGTIGSIGSIISVRKYLDV